MAAFVTSIARFCNRFWIPVLLLGLGLTAGSVWISVQRLRLVSERNALVNPEADFNQRFEDYLDDFGDTEYVIIVVQGRGTPQDVAAMKRLAHRVAERLRRRTDTFDHIIERIDPDDLGDAALLYLPSSSVESFAEEFGFVMEAISRYDGLGPEAIARSLAERIRRGDCALRDLKGEARLATGLLSEYYYSLKGDASEAGAVRRMLTESKVQAGHDPDGYLFSEDGTLLYLQVMPKKSSEALDQIQGPVSVVREVLAGELSEFPGLRAGVTGLPTIYSDEMVTTNRDMTRASILAFALVGLLFIVSFRSLVRPMLAVVSLAMAIAWTFGFTTLALGHLNLFAMVFTIVLVALGIDFGIHILTHYRRLFHFSTRQAVTDTYTTTGRGLLIGGLTTAAAFLSATLTGFRGLAELGIISGVGLLLCLLAMCTVFPALLGMVDGYRRRPILAEVTPATERPPGALGWIAVVLLAAGGVALTPGLTFDYNLLKLQSPALDSVVWEHVMLDRDPRSLFCVSLCRTREELEARRKQFEQLEAVGRVESMFPAQEERKRAILTRLGDRIEPLQIPPLALPDPDRIRAALEQLARVTDDPPFRNLHKISYGVHDRIGANPTPEERDRVFTILRDTERRIRDQLAEGLDRVKRMCRVGPIDAAALPLEMRRMFVGSKSGAHALKINPAGDIWDWDSLREFVSAARKIDPKIVGVPVQTFESSRLLLRAFLKAAWISLCAITLLIGLSFWNFKDLVTALSPLLLGLALLLGIMRLTGISFNFANFFAVPILIGTAVDHGVHLVNSARVGTPLASTRRAVTLCSLTTIIGFGMLAFSAHRGIASLGQVLAIGSACSLLVSHTVTEALIRRWRPTPDATA